MSNSKFDWTWENNSNHRLKFLGSLDWRNGNRYTCIKVKPDFPYYGYGINLFGNRPLSIERKHSWSINITQPQFGQLELCIGVARINSTGKITENNASHITHFHVRINGNYGTHSASEYNCNSGQIRTLGRKVQGFVCNYCRLTNAPITVSIEFDARTGKLVLSVNEKRLAIAQMLNYDEILLGNSRIHSVFYINGELSTVYCKLTTATSIANSSTVGNVNSLSDMCRKIIRKQIDHELEIKFDAFTIDEPLLPLWQKFNKIFRKNQKVLDGDKFDVMVRNKIDESFCNVLPPALVRYLKE